MYEHLQLRGWPFRDVPDKEFSDFLADRSALKTDLENLLRFLSRRPTSSIHLMWAWFGAGKTHALYYLENMCKVQYNEFIPIYIEFPRSIKGFRDLYLSLISGIDMEIVDEAVLEVFDSDNFKDFQNEIKRSFPDLAHALRLHFMGSEEQQRLIEAWLRTECTDVRSLRSIGINKAINNNEIIILTLTWLIKLISKKKPFLKTSGTRIIWMIDEFQKLGDCRANIREEINASLHSVFNRCPNSISIILSFSGHPQEGKLPEWLSPEIKDRIGIDRVLLLPPLRSDEAIKFVEDVLNHFRDQKYYNADVFFPFNLKSVTKTINIIENNKDELKPRRIMQYFKAVLEEAEPLMEKKELSIITSEFVDKILEGRRFLDSEV